VVAGLELDVGEAGLAEARCQRSVAESVMAVEVVTVE